MERLTQKTDYCAAFCRMEDRRECAHWTGCVSMKCGDARRYERLAAYEDTGLTPEVCANYKKFEDEAISKGVTFGRIVELMEAESDGRLEVLPCGVGGTVWVTFSISGDYLRKNDAPYRCKVVFIGLNGEQPFMHIEFKTGRVFPVNLDQIGKRVFLTREEAERALKAKEEKA